MSCLLAWLYLQNWWRSISIKGIGQGYMEVHGGNCDELPSRVVVFAKLLERFKPWRVYTVDC